MYYQQEVQWAAAAEALKPQLIHRIVQPVAMVKAVEDPAVWQGWRCERIASPQEVLGQAQPTCWEHTFDFGTLCVGYVTLKLQIQGIVDAPLRIEVKFAETPCELGREFHTYQGDLSRSWLQEALIVEDNPPEEIALPRRYTFRYLRLRVVVNSSAYQVTLKQVLCDTVSSADCTKLPTLDDSHYDQLDCRIYNTGMRTLAACMQEFFEDGPKRDRRLWLGDLRLQAIANYHSFKNFALVKRCLLMFAAAADDNGEVPGSLYPGQPRPKAGNFLFDYAVLFGDSLLDYVNASGDEETGKWLFPVAKRQSQLALAKIAEDGCYHYDGSYWLFIDWKEELQRQCAAHCIITYSLMRTLELARRLGLESEVAEYPAIIEKLRQNGRQRWYNPKLQYFTCGEDEQISWASQIWAAFAEMLPAEQMRDILQRVVNQEEAVRPGGPFLHNQMVLAMEKYAMTQEAYHLTRQYWGKMVELNADTFWEIFDPNDPMRSPYGDPIINSHCHAWSTPVFAFK